MIDLEKIPQFTRQRKAAKKQRKKRTLSAKCGRVLQSTVAFFSAFFILVFSRMLKKSAMFLTEYFTVIYDWWKYFVWSVKHISKNKRYQVACGGLSKNSYFQTNIRYDIGERRTCTFELCYGKLPKFYLKRILLLSANIRISIFTHQLLHTLIIQVRIVSYTHFYRLVFFLQSQKNIKN